LPDGRRVTSYYVTHSAGIATGMLIAAVHHAVLVSLTHTLSPLGFLNRFCGLDADYRPFLLLVVGYPAAGAKVPDIRRKPLDEIASFISGSLNSCSCEI
jgi:iodotyrosine deiodinase